MENNMDWDNVEKYLKTIREQYEDISKLGMAANVKPVLHLVITPLEIRFNAGERTKRLYDEIMSLE